MSAGRSTLNKELGLVMPPAPAGVKQEETISLSRRPSRLPDDAVKGLVASDPLLILNPKNKFESALIKIRPEARERDIDLRYTTLKGDGEISMCYRITGGGSPRTVSASTREKAAEYALSEIKSRLA